MFGQGISFDEESYINWRLNGKLISEVVFAIIVGTASDIEKAVSRLPQGSDGERNNAAEFLVATLKRCFKVSDLFATSLAPENRPIVCAALIRATTIWPEYFKSIGYSAKVVELCLNTFPRLADDLKIDRRQQTHEKEAMLLSAFANATSDLRDVTGKIRALGDTVNFRGTLLRVYNTSRVQAFIAPFLAATTRSLIQSKEVYENITAYSEAQGFEKVEACDRLQASLDELNALPAADRTEYDDLFIELFARILNLIRDDLAAESVLEKATVVVEPANRKYPLREVDCRFNLGLTVTNNGPGVAFDVLIEAISDLTLTQPTVLIQRMMKGVQNVSIPAIASGGAEAELFFRVTWRNSDQTIEESEGTVVLKSQELHVAWDQVDAEDLYSVDAISDTNQLIGRESDLSALTSGLGRPNPSSFVLHGQKRVGKTSIVRTAKSILESKSADNFLVYTEGGEFRKNSAADCVDALADALVTGLGLDFKNFEKKDGTLAPVTAAVRHLKELNKNARFLFVIDEFDELPVDVYKPGPVSETLFLNLRSLSSRDGVGCVLVGSEKMAIILNQHGTSLNKWREQKVDYFDRDRDRSDFVELIRKPSAYVIEFADEAIDEIYFFTAGNPFFTKVLCRRILQNAKHRRDGFVDRADVRDAVAAAASEEGIAIFSHFWADGIFESGIRLEEISSRRRRIFYAIGDVLRSNSRLPRGDVIQHDILKSLGSAEVESELRDLDRRGVVSVSDQGIEFRVKLFREWLVASGSQKLLTNLDIEDDVRAERIRFESLTVQSAEIVDLVRPWHYQGRRIEVDEVRGWLQQFGPDLEDQRAMFELLRGVKFYSQDVVRAKMQHAFNMIARTFQTVKEDYIIKRDEYIVTYLDGPAKSGAYMAKLFCEENRLHAGSIVPKEMLRQHLLGARGKKKSVIAIDDFIGTGKSIRDYTRQLWSVCGDRLQSEGLTLNIVAVAGFENSYDEVRNYFKANHIDADLRVCDLLGDEAKAFSRGNGVFSDSSSQLRAEALAKKLGATIHSKAPLGVGDQGALVVFDHNCPNNTLPILWREYKNRWKPLFLRSL